MVLEESAQQKLSLFSITWPIFIEVFLFMLMGNIDTMMLSKVSDDAVAAVGVTNQIISIAIVMFGFVSAGASIVVAQNLGAKQYYDALKIGAVAIGVNFLFGILLSGMMAFFSPVFLDIMNVPIELQAYSKSYMLIVGGFLFVQAALNSAGAVLRSNGFTRDAMYVSLSMNVMNIIGNSIFIFGLFGFPKLGVTGVAISTTITRIIGFIAIMMILSNRLNHRYTVSEFFNFKKYYIKGILSVGLPAAGEHLAYNTSQILNTYFITMMGTLALTTKVYAQNLSSFIFLFSVSVAQGTQILVGHLVGAKKNDDAYHTALRSLKISFIVSVSVAILFSVLSKYLFRIFTVDPSIIELGSTLLMINILLEAGRTFNLVLISSLRAAGDVNFPVIMGVISMFGVSVTLTYVLGIHFGLGLIGAWLGFAADEWFRGIFMFFRWKSRIWQKKVLVKHSAEIV
ncbi:MATE family efflux transporter [Tepidibacillus sp. HK-1]|uniref:MATE family efflux transporter n=1 Tax=Tepidibacillus sp. HK-1 TaxID=1883407 RepID=UPI0008534E22|nr:MATE family efflux transporter [Tepidibacillus sp. HK-1]GBF11116.1 multidrug resistance protein NorM [Tepidibacillus sp. HK-1]